MSEKVTGPNWEIPENANKVELRFPASWGEKIGLNLKDHPETLEEHIKDWIMEEITDINEEATVGYKINDDHSFVVTISAGKTNAVNEVYEAAFENAYREGAEIIAY